MTSVRLRFLDGPGEVLAFTARVEALVLTNFDDQPAGSVGVDVFGCQVAVSEQGHLRLPAHWARQVSVWGWVVDVLVDDSIDIRYTLHWVRLSRRSGWWFVQSLSYQSAYSPPTSRQPFAMPSSFLNHFGTVS